MQLIGSIIPSQYWESFILPSQSEAIIIDFAPLAPDLENIQSIILIRRVFVIEGMFVKDEHFETLPKTDNEIIIFKTISITLGLLITNSFLEVCKVYRSKHSTYIEPNYLINVYALP